jgi:ABC-2 type transport system ATP-binding protein
VSSHLLSEIEQIADHIGVIHHGRLVYQGELARLRARQDGTLEDIFLAMLEDSDGTSA